jgi:hypothetical protein
LKRRRSDGTLRGVERELIGSLKLVFAVSFIALCVAAVALLGAAA